MNIKDIKLCKLYNIQALAVYNADNKFITFELPTGQHLTIGANDFEAVSPINGTKNTETAPKYDPCRKFRKGDKVRVVAWNGRLMFAENGKLFNCEEDEQKNGLVPLKNSDNDYLHLVHACHLQLHTVDEDDLGWKVIGKDGFLVARFCKDGHPRAKEAAEAERDRLNDEYRKEQI